MCLDSWSQLLYFSVTSFAEVDRIHSQKLQNTPHYVDCDLLIFYCTTAENFTCCIWRVLMRLSISRTTHRFYWCEMHSGKQKWHESACREKVILTYTLTYTHVFVSTAGIRRLCRWASAIRQLKCVFSRFIALYSKVYNNFSTVRIYS